MAPAVVATVLQKAPECQPEDPSPGPSPARRGEKASSPRGDAMARHERKILSSREGSLAILLRCYIRCRDSAVDGEGRSIDIRGFIRGKEKRGVGDLARLCQAARRNVHQAALPSRRVAQ